MDPIIDPLTTARAAYQAGRVADAIAAYQAVLTLDPTHTEALRKLAWLADLRGDHRQAVGLLDRLISLAPSDARAYQDLGLCLIRLNEIDAALAALRKAIAVDPGYAPAYCNLGLALEDHGEIKEAIAVLRKAPPSESHGPFIAYHLAALQARAGQPQHAPVICPPSYLVPLFDGYAERFDQHLFASLHYCGPKLLADIIFAHAGHLPAKPWDVLDLGCGTGMTAVPFVSTVERVVGVDLAPRMLQHAARRTRSDGRRLYDELLQIDAVAALRQYAKAFHLLLAADVFIYIGDLSAVFAAAQTALRPGGAFAFTIESHNGDADYVLLPTRRYAHSAIYIHQLTSGNGFEILACQSADLRKGEDGHNVRGEVYLLRKS